MCPGVGASTKPTLRELLVTNTRDANGKWVAPCMRRAASARTRTAESKKFDMTGQKEEVITSPADIARITKLVEATRVAHGHKLNHRSSRSHCLITVTLQQVRARRACGLAAGMSTAMLTPVVVYAPSAAVGR